MAWRIGQELGIPASAWVFGTDARVRKASSQGRAVARALQHSDVVFYQSHELLGKVAALLNSFQRQVLTDRHVVLPHGIPVPPALAEAKIRSRVRKRWGVADEQLLVLSIGRICRDKGIFELLDAIALAAAKDPKICCVVVGSNPAFDETRAVNKALDKMAGSRQQIKLLPAVSPEEIWECLCAADIFAFTSHHEGMPNSLLEAMAMGLPSVAFAIPPVHEIESGTGAVVLVPPFDPALFADPAWDILLELYAAHLGQQRVTITNLCLAVEAPATTALRWLTVLERRDMVLRTPDPTDRRRVFVALAPDAFVAMNRFFKGAPAPEIPA